MHLRPISTFIHRGNKYESGVQGALTAREMHLSASSGLADELLATMPSRIPRPMFSSGTLEKENIPSRASPSRPRPKG